MKVLVTGGGGFLGRSISKKLLDRGDDVYVLGRREYPDLKKLGINTLKGDIQDYKKVKTAVSKVDSVIHSASKIDMWGKREDFVNINIGGTKNVVKACQANKIDRLVYTSSPSVAFGTEPLEGVDESTPYPDKYLALYPETKSQAERFVIKSNGKKGLHTCSLRPHLIWGPQDPNLIGSIVERAKEGKIFQVGDGKNLVDIVYVDNAADSHLLALDRLEKGSPVSGSIYFISQGKPENCWNWLRSILKRLDLPQPNKTVSFKTAYALATVLEGVYKTFPLKGEPRITKFLAHQLAQSHYFDISAAKQDLDYRPKISTKKGMDLMIKEFKTRMEH